MKKKKPYTTPTLMIQGTIEEITKRDSLPPGKVTCDQDAMTGIGIGAVDRCGS